MPHCLVEGCHFRNRKENSCRHFSFPDCEKTCQKWLEQLNRQDYKVTKNSRLCMRHFAPEAFLKPEENFSTKGRKRKRIWLKPLAIPTLEMKMQHHCYKCTYQCWEESTMKLHVSEKHKEIESSEIENLECKTCEVSFGAKDAFEDHMKRFHAVPGNLNSLSKIVFKESFDTSGDNNDYSHDKNPSGNSYEFEEHDIKSENFELDIDSFVEHEETMNLEFEKEAKLHKIDPSDDKIENSNDKVLIDEGKIEVRYLDKTDQLWAKCKTCEVSFGAKDAFVDHMKRFHAVELELYGN